MALRFRTLLGPLLAMWLLGACGRAQPAPQIAPSTLPYVPKATAVADGQPLSPPTEVPKAAAATPATSAVPLPTAAASSPTAAQVAPSSAESQSRETPSAVAAAIAMATATPNGDPRFGLIIGGQADATAHALALLHAQWFIGAASADLAHAPTRVQPINPDDLAGLAADARQYPGRYWSLELEPNGWNAPEARAQPAAYAQTLHAVATALKAADPTARLIGPDVLNWSAPCIGCGGMVTGEAWTQAMRAAYLADYGQEVPIDVWTIHTYPLDWQHLPTVNYPLMEQQLIALRQYLDGIPSLAGRPIWDTELGAHWGYTAYQFKTINGRSVLVPAGTLRSDLVEDYVRQMLAWLVANGARYGVARWFVFATYNPDLPGDHAGSISLLDGPGPNANLTVYGRIYLAAQGGR